MPDPSPATTRARPPWWFRVARVLLNLALSAFLVVQLLLFFRLSTHQPLQLPEFLRNTIEQRLQMQGVSVRFSSMEVSLAGALCVRNPQIFLTGTPEPVAEADALLAEPDWLALLTTRQTMLSRLELENARLYCPPEVSDSGTREMMIHDFDLKLEHDGGDWWRLEYLRVHILNARLLARGTFIMPAKAAAPAAVAAPAAPAQPPPALVAAAPPPPPPTLAAQYRTLAHQIVALQAKFARVQNPVVALQLDGEAPATTNIRIFAQMDGAEPPMENSNITLGNLWVRASAVWNGRLVRSALPATAWLESLHFVEDAGDGTRREVVNGGPAWARVQLADGPNGVLDRPAGVAWMISPVNIYGFAFDSMGATSSLKAWPDLAFDYYASRDRYWLKANGSGNLTAETLGMHFEAFVDPAVVLAAAREKPPKELASLKFAQPPRASGNITLAPGYKPQSLDFTLLAGGAEFDNINVYALRAQGRLTPQTLDVSDIALWNPQWHLEGSYAQDLHTEFFRILGRGTLDPGTLTPYMGDWWPQIWDFVVPGAQQPHADIDFQGCWINMSNQTLFGGVQLEGARAKGVLMDDIALRLYLRHDVVAVYQMNAEESGGGALTGAMLWLKMPPYHKNYEQRYLFQSTLPLASAAALAGKEVIALTKPLNCPTPPHIEVDQRTGGSSNPQANLTTTRVQASLMAPFKAYNVPLDNLHGNVTIYDGFTDIPELDFGIADGQARAAATITRIGKENELAFNVTLLAGHHTGVIYALSQMKAADEPAANVTAAPTGNSTVTPPANMTAAGGNATAEAAANAKAKSAMLGSQDLTRPGKMDLSLAAKVMLGHGDSFAAMGHVRIYEAKLGQLQLFGPLSAILAGTFLPIGSLDLDAAESDLQMAHSYARLPNLRITGPSAKVVSAGLYNFSSEQLSFYAVLFPMGSWNVPVISQIIDIFSPVNNTLTVHLTGNLSDPHYSVGVNPLRMFTEHTVHAPPIPGFPSNPDGSPVLPAMPFVAMPLPPLAPSAPVP